ncbi:MAG TPA: transcriptional regulator [Rhodospirillaceae bacterium]|nr:transcriptional regulator [Rhodospirillaceae bacterium]HAT35799.1 transcriptional regulator [Rhodospirillaceae bacterium]
MFAIEAVLDIAYNAADRPVQSSEIAERQGIPKRYLEQVLQHLVRAGILRGVRGPRGGYRLARERRRIFLGEIARLIGEMDGGLLESPAGSDLGREVLIPIWQDLQEDSLKRLDAISIEDLCLQARDAGIDQANKVPMDFAI